MGGISNIYMDNVLRKIPLKFWDGVYSADTIPYNLLERNFAIIVNFSNYNEKGTHFIALAQIGNKMFLFDTLATSEEEIPNSIKKVMQEKNGLYLFKFPIQDIFSQHCGFYCMYFILYLSLPPHLRQTYSPSLFSPINLKANDDTCISMIKNMIEEIKKSEIYLSSPLFKSQSNEIPKNIISMFNFFFLKHTSENI